MAIAYWAAADLLRVQVTQSALISIKEYEGQYEKLVTRCIETFKSMADTEPMRMRGGRYYPTS